MLETIDSCPAPVVCAVHGYALGGGSGLVACADIGIAQPDAVFGFTEVRLGIIPAVISPFVLARIGAAARRYFVTGERFDADTALRIGLVSEVVEERSGGRVGRGIDPRGRPRGRARGEAARARAPDRDRDCANRGGPAHERRGPGRAACLPRLDEGEPGTSPWRRGERPDSHLSGSDLAEGAASRGASESLRLRAGPGLCARGN